MAAPRLSHADMLEAVTAAQRCGSITAAAKELGINRSTFDTRLRTAQAAGITPASHAAVQVPAEVELRDKVRTLEAMIASHQRETLDDHYVKQKIIGLAEMKPRIPAWLLSSSPAHGTTGVPTLMLSDLHWGEVVDPDQIGGVNAYNLALASERLRRVVETAIDLLTNHMANPKYPGIVLILGGDMVTGDIHEELTATNEKEIMPTVLDLWGALAWAIETLADKFGHVFVPAVTGNHGRNTHKIRAKGRAFTSFDWLLYQFLAKRFEGDKRIAFFIPSGPDALYSVYGHKYLLTHGDQFRGGDSMIGCLGPLTRGDHKKRSRNGQIDMEYDTLVVGHWHQLIQMQRLIVNGSLVGYNEYAYAGNFGFEAPKQALWITHPDRGITFSMPVHADPKQDKIEQEWVTWAN
jgi:hypothetical protein